MVYSWSKETGLADLSRSSLCRGVVFSLENTWGRSYSGYFLHMTVGICTWTRREGFAIISSWVRGLEVFNMAVVMIIAQSHSELPLLPTLEHHLPLGPSAERRRCQVWGWVPEEHCCWEDEWVLLKGGEWTSDKGFQGVSEQLWSTGQARASLSIASVSLGRVSVSEYESRQEEFPVALHSGRATVISSSSVCSPCL